MEDQLASSQAYQEKLPSDAQPQVLEKEDPQEKPSEKLVLVGSKLEAQTDYKSSYYQPSYEFPWNPDPLVVGNDYKIYDEMRNDDQIKAVLSVKKDFVVNTGWYIECENEVVKEFITDNFTNLDDDGGFELTFDEILRDILSAYDYGFSIAEPVLKLGERNLWKYATVVVRPPHSFRFDIDKKGNILKVLQSTEEGEKEFDPNIFLHFAYQQEYRNPYGKSDLRAAHIAWRSKKFFIKMFNVYVERFATPTVAAKYPGSYQESDVTNLHNRIKSIQNSTIFTLPDNIAIEFIQPAHDASTIYIDGMGFYNLLMARALLVPDLLGIGGSETQGGSFALGKEHFRLFLNTIEKDRLLLERKVTQRLIRPLVQANWGDYPCQFKFHPFSQTDELEMARLWKDIISTGKISPTEKGVAHIESVLRLPEESLEIQEHEQQNIDPLTGRPMPGGKPGFPGNSNDKTGGKEDALQKQEDDKKDKDAKEQEEKKLSQIVTERHFRKLTAYEKKLNFTDIREVLDTSDDKVTPKLLSAAKDIYKDYIRQIREKRILGDFKPEKIEALQPHHMKAMNIIFKRHFTDLFEKSLEQARRELFPNGDKNFVKEGILPEEYLEVIEAESFKAVGDYTTEITKKAKNKLVQGLKDGLSDSELSKMLQEELEDVSERWINTVVRTKTTEMYNDARKIYWENDPLASQIVEGYQWSAILDDRVSGVCEYLDGKMFPKGEFIDRVTPPIHFNAIMKGESVTTEKGPKKIENIQKGDVVLTHMGRWQMVYDVMSKENDDFDYVLEILTQDGYIRLTPDHPVLTEGRWSPAGCLRVGDKVFKALLNPIRPPIASDRVSVDSKDSIPLFNKPLISFDVGQSSFSPSPLLIYLHNNITRWDEPIRNISPDRNLKLKWNLPPLEILTKLRFSIRRVLSEIAGKAICGFDSTSYKSHWVSFSHSNRASKKMRVSQFSKPRSPMFKTWPLSNNFYANARCLALSPCFNPKLSASINKSVNAAHPKGFRYAPKGLAFSKMALLNHGLDEFGTVNTHTYNYNEGRRILSIRKIPYIGEVYNLAVENDESYVVNGVVVHNCRSILVPVTKFELEQSDFDEEPPIDRLKDLGGNLII